MPFASGNRHDQTGRTVAKPRDRRFAARNRPPPDEPWVWFTRALLESDAFRSLSRPALLCLFRVILEHMAHAGTANGALVVPFDDFAKYGVRRKSVAGALAELQERGLITKVVAGGRAFGSARVPNRYRLEWLPSSDGTPARNGWKSWRATKRTASDDDDENNSPGAKPPPTKGR